MSNPVLVEVLRGALVESRHRGAVCVMDADGATVFSLGAHSRPVAGMLLRGWDLSYGLYVFHMLVVNTFIALGLQGSWTYVFLIIGIALSIAALSWKFVERPSIRMKEPLFGILWKRGNSREQSPGRKPLPDSIF